jgi:MFS family permease
MIAHRFFGAYRDAYTGLSSDLWLLALVALVNRAGSMVLPFVALYLTVERGFTTRDAGRIVALYGVGAVVGAYLGGWLSDRIGAVRTQQTSLALGGAGFLALGSLRGRFAIAIGILVVSVVVEAFRPAVMTSVAERAHPGQKARAFALLRLAANLGFGIGPALGGLLASHGYRWLFIGDAATCWAAALLLTVLPLGERLRPTDASSEEKARRSPWRDGPFLAMTGLTVVLASCLFQFFSTLPLYFREEIGLLESRIGALLSLNALTIVAFEMVLIHAVRDRDRMRLSGAGAFLVCAGYALVPYGASVGFLALTILVWTFGEMLVLPVLNAVAAERAGPGFEGQYMGLYAMAYSIAFILAPITGTLVYERLGPATLWHGMGLVGVTLGSSFWALSRFFRSPGPKVLEG